MVTLSGRLLLPAPVVGAPLREAPVVDTEPNDSLVAARLVDAAPEGRLDAARDPVDAFRAVARTGGTVTASVDADGVEADVVLHDLATGAVGRSLAVAPGTVYDVVVTARRGAGAYRVRLAEGAADPAPAALPGGYLACGDGFVPRQIVVAPAAGVSPAALAAASGLRCLAETPRACLLETPAPRADAEVDRLCVLLARCARLEADGVARFAEPNYLRRLAATPDDPLYGEQWGMEQIRAPAAWELQTDADVVVAFVDSGIRMHPELVSRLVPGYDFRDDDADPTDLTVTYSHGTQVAGVIAAAGDNGVGVAGVVWNGKVMPVRAFGTSGFGVAFDIANSILFAAGLDNVSGTLPATPARVINLSFASGVPTQIEEDACDAAVAAGALVVAATGNDGRSDIQYPAGYASVLAVGATTINGTAASYSNYGSWLDLVAPGGTAANGIRTTGVNAFGTYTYPEVDGTSFAAPHVAGVAALVLAAAPATTVAELRQILIATAQDVGDPGLDERHGHGIVDAYRALLAALGVESPLLIPGETVTVRLIDEPAGTIAFSVTTTQAAGLFWTMENVSAGTYRLIAGTDRDFDGEIDDAGEVAGAWTDGEGGEVLTIGDGAVPDLDFAIAPR
jgi:serine protease